MYADTSGWIVVFFKNDEPAAMMMQWGKDTDVDNPVITEITSTTLEDAINKVADAADILWTVKDVKYYDFEYPDANGMTLLIKDFTAPVITNVTVTDITNSSDWNITASWQGYKGDWHNISFNKTFTLVANKTYNYTIITGSYPQIIHESSKEVTGGVINCTEFVDKNGKKYNDWIPAIRLS